MALACSVATHSAIAAYARGSMRLSAALFAGIIATLTSLAIVVGAYAPAKPARLSHSALSVLLIVLLTVGLRMVKRGSGGAGFEDDGGSSPIVDDSFPGVILLRELEKNAVLIAPNLKRNAGAKGTSLFNAAKPETLTAADGCHVLRRILDAPAKISASTAAIADREGESVQAFVLTQTAGRW